MAPAVTILGSEMFFTVVQWTPAPCPSPALAPDTGLDPGLAPTMAPELALVTGVTGGPSLTMCTITSTSRLT